LWLIPLTPDYMECDGPPILLPTTPGDAIDFAGSIAVAPPASQIIGPAPGLFIRQTAEAVVVYWSTNYVGYTLESETNLPDRAWSPIAGPYYLNGVYLEYWEPRAGLSQQKFYRLHFTGAFVLSEAPTLTIQLQGNNAVLSWSGNAAGFVLQSKSDLSPALAWKDLPGPYGINGGNLQYSAPISPAQSMFYRLRSP
jgi:hypothetical protein